MWFSCTGRQGGGCLRTHTASMALCVCSSSGGTGGLPPRYKVTCMTVVEVVVTHDTCSEPTMTGPCSRCRCLTAQTSMHACLVC
jgi:hypothetical protein